MTEEKRIHASWHMTNFCNFNCHYCYSNTKKGVEKIIPIKRIIKTLRETGEKWCIGMTGGEPFLFPNFIELCKLLNKNDIKIAIDTNLSINSKVREFINNIDPDNVQYMYISTHIEEREKRNEVEQFIKNLLLLKENKFYFSVNYVLHPILIEKFKKDYKYFESKGIELKAKPFKGEYNEKKYPESYSDNEKKLILMSDPNAYRCVPFCSKGIKCNAGKTMVMIEMGGDVSRCAADKTNLGNIFKSIKLNNEAEPCIVDRCPCFGVNLIQDSIKLQELKKKFN